MGEQNMAYDRMKPKCAGVAKEFNGIAKELNALQPVRAVDLGPPSIGQTKCGNPGPQAGPIERKLDSNKEQAECLRQSLYDLRHKLAPVLPLDLSKTASEGEPSSGSSPLLGDLEDLSNILKNCQTIVGEIVTSVEL